MMAFLDRQNTVITQAINATPDHDVAVQQRHFLTFVAPFKTTISTALSRISPTSGYNAEIGRAHV